MKKEQENLRNHLFEMADATNKEILSGLNNIRITLTKPISNLNSYVEYVN